MAERRRPSRTATAHDRFARRRRRGRLSRWRGALTVVVVVGVAVGAGWLVFWSDVLDVDEVAVTGTSVLSPAEVEKVAAVRSGAPLARVDLDAVTSRVEGLPAVASAAVTRSWPGTVAIEVDEREAIAVVEDDGSYQGLDATGVLFRSYSAPPADLPLVRAADLDSDSADAGQGEDGAGVKAGDTARAEVGASRDDALREVALVIEALPAAIGAEVDHVEFSSLDSILLVLSDGSQVQWGSAEQSALKADVLETLMTIPATTYDVSVPGLPTTSG
jgi:cell division protein FtsQ